MRRPDPARGADRAEAAVRRLTRSWALWWPGEDVEALARDVLARAPAGLEVLDGGNVALVLASDDVVVKVLPRTAAEDLSGEVRALRHWAPSGAVPRVLEDRDGGLTYAMERVVPGTTADDLPFEERLDVLGALARRLHACDTGDEVLLHHDLHGGNALRGADGWKVIDPHAVVGDRHADIWALIDGLAPGPPDPATARAWVARYARAAGLDPERAATFVRRRAATEIRDGADGDAGWLERLRAWTEHLGG